MGENEIVPFVESDFTIAPKSVFIGELVGKGNFSKVFKGLHMGTLIAIKKQAITDDELERYLLNELAILRFCDHPHIVKYIGASRPEKKEIWSLTEYLPGGELKMLLNSKINLSWGHKVDILWKTADALQYLHANNIIHRDIKTDNVMLGLDLNPKLIDLGFARSVKPWPIHEPPEETMTCLGTDDYMAPEVTFAMPYHFAADVFSFGLTIFEVCTKSVPKRTARNGFCVEWEEAKETLTEHKTPQSLALLVEQAAADEGTERLEMNAIVEWLEDLSQEMKMEKTEEIHLNEEEILKAIQARWQAILESGEDPHENTKIDPSDLETGFLAEDVPPGKNKEMELRRRSVNRALKLQVELVPLETPQSDLETDVEDDFQRLATRKTTEVTLKSNKSEGRKKTGLVSGLLRSGKRKTKRQSRRRKGSAEFWNIKVSGKKKDFKFNAPPSNNSFFSKSVSQIKKMRVVRKRPRKKRAKVKASGVSLSKKGFVSKKNQFGFFDWVKEWLVLTPEGLLYFKDEDSQKKKQVKGALLFMDMVHPIGKTAPALEVSVALAGKPFCFQILTKERKIVFQASTKGEQREWIMSINKGYAAWQEQQK